MELLFKEETYAIRGALYEVYNVLGAGFLEAVYQEALEIELAKRKIPFQAQLEIPLTYKDVVLQQRYRVDFLCYDKIILEIKAVKQLMPEHEAQLHNYLHATQLRLGLLVNFASFPSFDVRRIIV